MDEVKVDRRTKEYRESLKSDGETSGKVVQVDYDLCNDPHGVGCRNPLPPLDSGGKRTSVMSEPCRECVFRNF